MGICGYTYDQVQDMPMAALAVAIKARVDWIDSRVRSVLKFFGAEFDEPAVASSTRQMSPDVFDALFG